MGNGMKNEGTNKNSKYGCCLLCCAVLRQNHNVTVQ
jgi:hypothetical protein